MSYRQSRVLPALDALARLCRTCPFGDIDAAPVNRELRARVALPAAAAKLAGWATRTVGARRPFQELKNEPRLTALIFRPALSEETRRPVADGMPVPAAALREDSINDLHKITV